MINALRNVALFALGCGLYDLFVWIVQTMYELKKLVSL